MTGPATLSLGRVAFLDDGTWRADPSGAPAVLIPVHDRDGVAVDIIAYHLDDPSEWRLRYGDCCPILGAEALAMAAYHRDPVTLCSTPERWLLARSHPGAGVHLHHQGGDETCVLDWGVDLGPLFAEVSHIQCDSVGLHDQMQRAIRSWEPEITAPGQNLSAARGFREAHHAA